jgi:hypothetical protein
MASAASVITAEDRLPGEREDPMMMQVEIAPGKLGAISAVKEVP